MTRPVIQAPADRLAYLRQLQVRKEKQDAERLAQADAFGLIGYEPICKPRVLAQQARDRGEDAAVPEPCGGCPQELFHAATEDAVLYGGSAGGGKSAALVAETLKVATRYPGIRILLLRRSYDELAESIYPEYRRFDWGAALGGKWHATDKEISFPNASLIRLRYMETADDASRRQGGAYQLLCVDELSLMPPGVVATIVNERLRSAHGIPVLGVRASSNPGGASHGEVKSRYVDATGNGTKVHTDDNGLTTRFIKARATDNPFLDEAYFRRLDSIPDPARRAAMRDGDWGQFAGQMFPELRFERHTCDPITLPPSWKRYVGVDWGYAKPWAVVWIAVDPDGRLWMYREEYEAGVGETEQALRILAAEEDHEYIAVRYADDAMWTRLGESRPIADVYAENGVHLTPAGKGTVTRIQGWQRWHSYMEEAPACPMHRAPPWEWETCPKVHIFRTLPKLWWEMSNLPHAKRGNPEDANSEAPDHACLVAGTMVETSAGPVPIEQVARGCLVHTRSGLRRVTAAGITARNASTGTVQLSNGSFLRGTASHPVWVATRGWTRLDELRYADIILTWPEANVISALRRNLLTWKQSARSPQNGIEARKAGRGTRSTLETSRLTGWPTNWCASSAGPHMSPSLPVDSAASTAKPNGAGNPAWMTNSGSAPPVAGSSLSTSTPEPVAAAVSVLGCFVADSELRDVYNLTVEGAHEFYANGVLVHNCDASRYVLINLGGEARFHFPQADPAAGLPRLIVPAAAGTRDYEGPPLPEMIGGFPVLHGDDPWRGLLDR